MPTPPSTLPRRVAWFAPWTWKPWLRWTLRSLLLLAAVVYPLSIGPAVYMADYGFVSRSAVIAIYRPILCALWRSQPPVGQACIKYLHWWSQDEGARVLIDHSKWEGRAGNF